MVKPFLIYGKAIANLGYSEIKYLFPVFINDVICTKSKILDKRELLSKKDRGIVTIETIAYNQDAIAVLSFKRNVLIKKKNHEE